MNSNQGLTRVLSLYDDTELRVLKTLISLFILSRHLVSEDSICFSLTLVLVFYKSYHGQEMFH